MHAAPSSCPAWGRAWSACSRWLGAHSRACLRLRSTSGALSAVRHLPFVAVYVMLYSIHYFVMKTKMTGFFQTAFYFGYTLMFCIGGRGVECVGAFAVAPKAVVGGTRAVVPRTTTACRLPALLSRRRALHWLGNLAGLSMMCGAVGYLGSLAFVRRIFAQVKVD